MTTPLPFREIAGFRPVRMLGFGGFGDIYEVERKGERYALKLFRAELAAAAAPRRARPKPEISRSSICLSANVRARAVTPTGRSLRSE